jgi:hypothetical protein
MFGVVSLVGGFLLLDGSDNFLLNGNDFSVSVDLRFDLSKLGINIGGLFSFS